MQEVFVIEDVLNILIELETLANKHYIELAKIAKDEKLAALFDKLAVYELDHKKIFTKLKSKAIKFPTSEVTPEYTRYLDALLKNTIKFIKSQTVSYDYEEGFELAVKLEKDTILFLSETRPLFGEEFHHEIDVIIGQEREHLRYLLEY